MAIGVADLRAQIVIDNSLTPQEFVEQILVGTGVSVSNVTYNGQANAPGGQVAIGSFTSANTILPLANGLVLASGGVNQIPTGSTIFDPGSGLSGDPDLLLLSGQASINDYSILEFDFVPLGDTIKFDFVFGSTEYASYTCTVFNDAFGFFLSGPGISGPFSNNATNLAIVPNTGGPGVEGIPITINTINSGSPTGSGTASTCAAADPNWQANSIYYVDNPNATDFMFNGFTVPLTAISPVQCGQTYHIKIAIGDGTDSSLDSGVFLEGGSFTSSPFIPTLTPGPGIVGTNTILESCYNVTLNLVRTGDTTVASVVQIVASGTSTAGVDYSPVFPDSVVFPPNVGSMPITFNVPLDPDGTETLVLALTSQTTCGETTVTNTFEFIIDSPPPLTAAGFDMNIQCGDQLTLAPDITNGFPPFTIDWGGGVLGDSITVSPIGSETFTVSITDTCGATATAQFNIGLIPLPPLVMNLIGPATVIEACQSNQLNILRPLGVSGDLNITLTYSGGTNGSDFQMPLGTVLLDGNFNVLVPFQPLEDGEAEGAEPIMITASFTDDCGRTVDAAVNVTIEDAPPIEITGTEYFIECGLDSLQMSVVATGGYNDQLTITWDPEGEITGSDVWIPVYNSGTYTVVATDPCGRSESTIVSVIVDCEVVIPNVFSPNNDGHNDLWVIEGIQFTTNTVKVYNRWGQLVLDTPNYRNTWRASDLPDGTYFYEITVDRHDTPYTGHVTILRNGW